MRILIIIIVLLLISPTVYAQSALAEKLFEFGDLDCDDLLGYLDNFISEVHQQPGSRGYIIVYEGKHRHKVYRRAEFVRTETRLPRFAESITQSNFMLGYMHNFRRFDRKRVLLISGGYREFYGVELWVVPAGARPPSISPTLETVRYRKGRTRPVC